MHYVKSKGILTAGNGMNLYRGCSHGCIYCDSRSKCYHMEHDFEDIEVKENALELLEETLKKKRKKCMIGTGAMTDPYTPMPHDPGNMRGALEIINRHGFGVTLITKSCRVLDDIDILSEINSRTKAVVQMTITTYDDDLCRLIEPNVNPTSERAEALYTLRNAGIPTVVWLSPILPFINDTEENISGILDICEKAKVWGVICFSMGVTLREGSRDYFYKNLDKKFPGMKEKYIRTYGDSYYADSPDNPRLMRLFRDRCRSAGIVCNNEKVFAYLNEFEEKSSQYEQLNLLT